MVDAVHDVPVTDSAVDEAAVSDLLDFLESSPSPFHAVASAAARLAAAGFETVDPRGAWPSGPGRRLVLDGGALIAVVEPAGATATTPFRLVAAHTDSPTLRVKPHADLGAAGWRQVGVDVYGGALLNSWLDRDLGVAGRIALAPGTVPTAAAHGGGEFPGGSQFPGGGGSPAGGAFPAGGESFRDAGVVDVRVDRPLFRLPQLAIHLDRDVNTTGPKLDRQRQLAPVWGLGQVAPGQLRAVLAEAAGVPAASVLAHDLVVFDLTPPTRLGLSGELVTGARLDDQYCAWAAVRALVAAGPVPGLRTVVALFDHEEVGSGSRTGAAGPLLPDVLERVVGAAGGGRDDLHRALAGSRLVSADMAHAVHPNHTDRSEPAHAPVPNGGPVVKVNVNQRYATDLAGHAWFARACAAAGVAHQVYVHRSDLPCGSTIGPVLAARLGVPTVDVGAAQLSMHSARELAGAADAGLLVRALTAALSGAGS